MAKKFWTIRYKRKSRRVSVEFKFLISRSLTMAFRQCHSVVERVEDQCPLLPGPSSMKDPTINESLMYSRQKKKVLWNLINATRHITVMGLVGKQNFIFFLKNTLTAITKVTYYITLVCVKL